MVGALYLCIQIAVLGAHRKGHRVALTHLQHARHAARTVERGDQITHADEPNRQIGAIGHPDRRTGPDAFQVVRPPLPLAHVLGVLHRAEFDLAADAQMVGRQAPDGIGAPGEALGRAGDLFRAVDQGRQLGVLAAKDDAAPMRGKGQAQQQITLAPASCAAVEELVSLAQIGQRLRPLLGRPARARIQQQVHQCALGQGQTGQQGAQRVRRQ